jgi:RNA polymerase sigma-70 factor (ECF subfamily)
LESLFRQYYQRALRAAYRITGQLEDAEDCAQSVFLKLARDFDARQLDAIPASYIHRASVNAALDCLRSRKRHAEPSDPVELDLLPGAERDPEIQHADAECADALRQALARLRPAAAQIFALRYIEGVPNHEIARSLGKSRTAIAIVLLRARSQLRRHLRATTIKRFGPSKG